MKKQNLSSSRPKRKATARKKATPRSKKAGVDFAQAFDEVTSEEQAVPLSYELQNVSEVVEPSPVIAESPVTIFAQEDESANDMPLENEEVSFVAVTRPNSESKRMLLWLGVSVVMFAVVVGWAFTLPAAIRVPASPSRTANQLDDQFTNLFINVNKRLDDLKQAQASSPTSAPATAQPSPTLPPETVDRLKQNVLGAETQQPASNTVAPSTTPTPIAPKK